jgi:hypothetical protein
MWTPQGHYTGSPGAEKIVGWQIIAIELDTG